MHDTFHLYVCVCVCVFCRWYAYRGIKEICGICITLRVSNISYSSRDILKFQCNIFTMNISQTNLVFLFYITTTCITFIT